MSAAAAGLVAICVFGLLGCAFRRQEVRHEPAMMTSSQGSGDERQLRAAVAEGDYSRAKALLGLGVDSTVWKKEDSGLQLLEAVSKHEMGAAHQLLDLGADVAATDAAGCTALHYAVGDSALVRRLIEAGADVNARSKPDTPGGFDPDLDMYYTLGNATPLHIAAEGRLNAIVKILVEAGSDVSAQGPRELTPYDLFMSGGGRLKFFWGVRSPPAVVDEQEVIEDEEIIRLLARGRNPD